MSEQPPAADVPTYDLVGVGFGPSNLALAIALDEHNARADDSTKLHALFFERQETFGWHRGMLLADATMQVSFLKDLVTLRNPSSDFSFLAYLHSKGRLVDFINQKSLFPLRVEFHDYLEWAAASFHDRVHYGHEVVQLRPVYAEAPRDGRASRDVVAEKFDVLARPVSGGPERVVCRARNVVFGLGMEPNLPDGVRLSERIWHNRDLLDRVGALDRDVPARFAVVGSGQSAAEVTKYLHDSYPEAEVCAVFARYGYSPSDDSPFANRIFDPAAVDQFFVAPDEVKQAILSYHANTNYSVVDPELIEELYRRHYQEKVLGRRRLRVHNVSRLAEVVDEGTGVRATVESLATREKTVLDCDVLVYATGYRPSDPAGLLGPAASMCRRDGAGELRVERDYRVVTDGGLDAGVYLQGGTEHTHGISSSLLSNTVARVGDIVESVRSRRQAGRTCGEQGSAEHRVPDRAARV